MVKQSVTLFVWLKKVFFFFIIFKLEPTFIRIAPRFPEIKSFLQSSWARSRRGTTSLPKISLHPPPAAKSVNILFYCYIVYFMSDFACRRHEKDNSKSWSFLFLKILFKLRSINILELFTKAVFNKDQGCCREQLITLTLYNAQTTLQFSLFTEWFYPISKMESCNGSGIKGILQTYFVHWLDMGQISKVTWNI